MTARLPIALVALTLAVGCSKKTTHVSPEEAKQKLHAYILDKAPTIQHKLGTTFGDKVVLLGYNVNRRGSVRRGQKVTVTMYWQPKVKIDGGYKLFTHILDGSGEMLLRIDRNAPLRPNSKHRHGGLAVSAWEPGKVYADPQSFHIPRTKTDTIQIVTGLANRDGRMPITQGKKDSSERAIVGSLEIRRSRRHSNRVPKVDITRLEPGTTIRIDGKLDEPAWKKTPILGPFMDVRTARLSASQPMRGFGRMLWDDKHLYVGVQVQDSNIIGGFPKDAKDPHLWTKDAIELLIDPDGDGDNEDYYEIQINPQNLVFDSQFDKYNEPRKLPDGPFGHEEWSAKLKSAVVVNGTIDQPEDADQGYSVEAMIPWQSFTKAKKAPPELGDVWRMNLYGVKENAGVGWSPILGLGNFHKASRFAKVRFTAKGWSPHPKPSGSGAPASSGAPAASSAPPASAGVKAKDVAGLKVPVARPVSDTQH